MPWNFATDRPIYTQLLEFIRLKIISGQYPPGGKLPSVRELASEASVNPNTMQKALAELERSGLIYAQRTSGRFITEDKGMIQKLKEEIAVEQVNAFLRAMKDLGLTAEETLGLIEKEVKEMKQ